MFLGIRITKRISTLARSPKPSDAVLFHTQETLLFVAQSAGAVEYTDCFSAEGYPPPSECPGYDNKQSDGEVPAVLKLWRMRSTPSLPLLPCPLWPGEVAPDRALSMG